MAEARKIDAALHSYMGSQRRGSSVPPVAS
jgi:hypothetical protein